MKKPTVCYSFSNYSRIAIFLLSIQLMAAWCTLEWPNTDKQALAGECLFEDNSERSHEPYSIHQLLQPGLEIYFSQFKQR